MRHDARRARRAPLRACTADRWPQGEVSRSTGSRHGCCRADRARGRRVNELARRRFRVLPRTPREPRNARGWRFQRRSALLGGCARPDVGGSSRAAAGPSPGACGRSSVELYPCLGGVGRARRASGPKRASISSNNRGCRTSGGGGPGRHRRRSSFSRDEPSVRVDVSGSLPSHRPGRSSQQVVQQRARLGARCGGRVVVGHLGVVARGQPRVAA